MTELLRQIADDLRAVRRAIEASGRRWEFQGIVDGLVARGVITPADAEKALERIEEGKDN